MTSDLTVRCDRSDHAHASLDEARACYRAEADDALPPFYCACGATTFATEDERRAAQPNGRSKCPLCDTFASDHEWYGDESSDWRCYACDTRSGSHGGPNSWNAGRASYTFERALANGGVEA